MTRSSKSKPAKRTGKPKKTTPATTDYAPVPSSAPDEAVLSIERSVLDEVLSLQLLIAWAGEGTTDPPRLRWWRTSLVDEFGGEDLFKRLAPRTWKWAVLEAARTAARMVDAETRSHAADGDRLISLFHFGFSVDEQLDDRLAELKKRTSPEPVDAFPSLAPITQPWNEGTFRRQLASLADVVTLPSSVGVRLRGEMPKELPLAARMLAAAMAPPGDRYPAPHWKVDF